MSKLSVRIRPRRDRPGKWVVVVRRGTERNSSTFDAYEDARRYADEVERAEARGEFKNVAAPKVSWTLANACDAFLQSKKNEALAEKTLTTYAGLLKQTVAPALGSQRLLAHITAADVEAFRDRRLSEVSPTTVFREMDRLRAVFAWAQGKAIIKDNPVADVKLPKLRDEPKDWLRSNEIGSFLDACTGDFAAIAKFTIFTGLRRREVVFLQRGDVDLSNNVIAIRSKPHLGFTPKSGKERSVPIDPVLRPLLERRLREQVKPGLDAWVFAQRDGTRRSPDTRWFAVSTQEAARRVGIERRLTFHDLRRTYGAMLIEAGVGIYEVSRLLGHADVRITQKVYAPICGKFLAQEAAKLGQYLGRSLIREAPQFASLPAPTGAPGAENGCTQSAPAPNPACTQVG